MVESNKRQSKIFGFAMMMAICCLISGVLLCNELTKRTIEDRIPVEVIDVVDILGAQLGKDEASEK